ncbi:MAG: putative lipid II flippase FtsW [Deltaproteobacteria bacterium]|nr:MAG: putative lipid II flippase FtsW [Deltaproteobacteria bacterium]
MRQPPQYLEERLLLSTIVLVAFGLVMVLSSSFILAERNLGDGYAYFKKQLLFVAMGLALILLVRRIPYELYARLVYPLTFGAILLLCALYLPGFGLRINGARRWLDFGFFRFQPSEAAKIAMIVYLAHSLTKKADRRHTFTYGFLSHLLLPGVMLLFIIEEPDFGSVMIMSLVAGVMLFAGGVRIRYLLAAGVAVTPAIVYLVMAEGYRLRRILVFLDPFKDPLGDGYQIIHSLMSFAAGGTFGVGLGAGQQKLFFLPDPHTDFIFAIIGEELGLLGVLFVLLLFIAFIRNGLRVARWAPDPFAGHLAFGLTILIGIEAFVNMGVTLSLLPTKGLPLPFISYGGSSMLMSLLAVGILAGIARRIPTPKRGTYRGKATTPSPFRAGMAGRYR